MMEEKQMKIFSYNDGQLKKKRAISAILLASTITAVFFFDASLRLISEFDYGAYEIVNPHSFNWLILEKDLCNTPGNDLEVLAVIHTAPDHFEQRTVIRETYGSKRLYPMTKTKLVFALGWTPDASLQAAIKNESKIHRDIIQEDFLDSYKNLTYKSVMWLKFASEYCAQAKFILKADDDIFVNIFDMVDLMHQKKHESKSIICYVLKDTPVFRDPGNKWYVTEEEYANDTYTPYCGGSMYIISTDLCKPMYEQSFYTKFMWVDDWYTTGGLIEALHVNHTDISYMFGFNDNCTLVYEELVEGPLSIASIDDSTLRLEVWNKILDNKGIQQE